MLYADSVSIVTTVTAQVGSKKEGEKESNRNENFQGFALDGLLSTENSADHSDSQPCLPPPPPPLMEEEDLTGVWDGESK